MRSRRSVAWMAFLVGLGVLAAARGQEEPKGAPRLPALDDRSGLAIPFDSPKEKVVELLGAPEETEKSEDVVVWHYPSQGLAVLVKSDRFVGVEVAFNDELGHWVGAKGPEHEPYPGKTKGGLGRDATPDDARKLYGKPTREVGPRHDVLSLVWETREAVVAAIFSEGRLGRMVFASPGLKLD